MAVDVSTIALAVDSTAVVKAKDDLDSLVPSAVAVEKATDSVTRSTTAMGSGMNAASASVMRSRESMSDAAAKYVAALQKEIDTFGRTREEIERVEAASLRFTKAEQDKVAALASVIDKMHAEEEAAKALAAQQDRNAAASAAFIARLKEQTAAQGLSKAELLAHQAAQLGVTKEAAPLIAGLSEAGKGMEHFGFQTARSKSELLVLAHELSQGRYQRFGSSLMVLGEQTGVMSLAFSAAGIAILGTVAVLAGFTYEVIRGYVEQEHFNKTLTLTGNMAGQTNDSLSSLSKTLAASTNTTVLAARDVTSALVATGEVGPRLIGPIGDAVLRVQAITGEATGKIVADYAKLAEAPTKWALEHNKAMNFITVAMFEHIRLLEETGHKEEAALIASQALTDHLSGENAPAIGTITKFLHAANQEFSTFIEGMRAIGREQTMGERLDKVNEQLAMVAALKEGGQGMSRSVRRMAEGAAGNEEKLMQERTAALYGMASEARAAYTKSEEAQAQKEGIQSSQHLKQIDDRARGVDKLKIALDGLKTAEENEIKAQRLAGNADYTISPDVHAKRVAELERENKPRGVAKGPKYNPGNPEDLDMQAAQKAIAEESALYGMRDRMLSAYHSARIIDDTTYYAGRQTAQDLYLEKTKEGYVKEFSLLQSRINGAKDGAERIRYQKELVNAQEQYNKALEGIAATGATDAIKRIGDAQKEAAKIADAAAKDLQKRIDVQQKAVDAEQKTVDQMGLTKHQIEALSIARLEDAAATDAQTLATAKNSGASDKELAQLAKLLDLDQKSIELKKQNLDASTKFATGAQSAMNKYQDAAQNSAAFAEKFISGSFSKLEDVIVNFTKTGKLNFSSLFQFMADEFIRQQARMLISGQAGGASGGGGSGGLVGIVSGLIGSYFGSGMNVDSGGVSTNNTGTSLPTSGGRASGGSVNAGQNYLVGERGPEVLRMGNQSGSVTPNSAVGAGSQPVTLNVINNGQPMKATQSQRETSQGTIIDLVLEAVASDIGNGGKSHDAIQKRFGLNPGGSTPRY